MKTDLSLTIMLWCLLVCPVSVLSRDVTETKFGFYADRTIVASQTILLNENVNKRICDIGNRLAKASTRPDLNCTFRVINAPEINAYSAAGGFIYVNTGLLDVLESEDELAAVLAHELVHTEKKHQINFIVAAHRHAVAGQIVGAILGAGLGAVAGMAVPSGGTSYNPVAQQLHQSMVDIGVQTGQSIGGVMGLAMTMGYGREQELEADAGAVECLRRAGYDPEAMIRVLKKLIAIRDRLQITEQNYVSSLINADPGLEQRIKHAEELLGKGTAKPAKERRN